jgi:hypothetical protein
MNHYDPINIDDYSSGGSSSLASLSEAESDDNLEVTKEVDDVQKGKPLNARDQTEMYPNAAKSLNRGTASMSGADIDTETDDNIEVTKEVDDLQKGKPLNARDQKEMYPDALKSSGQKPSAMGTSGSTSQGSTAQGVTAQGITGQGSMPAGYSDSDFRRHWQSTYGASGGKYDEYEPAYRYGSTLAGNERWRGSKWSDMEAKVRSDWESKNEKGTWEKFKDSIRYGWEKMSGQSDESTRSAGSGSATGMSGSSSASTSGMGSMGASGGAAGISDTNRSNAMNKQPESSSRTTKSSAEMGRSAASSIPADAEYLSHWQHNYWSSGGSYDDYAPSYRWGADYADNDTNPNHQWSDVEMRMRSDWEAYNHDAGSWEKNKAAIQCGWEVGKKHGRGSSSGESLR